MDGQSITLSFTQGSSDKVYQAAIVPDGDGFLVNFAYGRRGKPLRHGTKTPEPVSLAVATTAYDNLIKAKMAKGYTEDGSGTPFTGSQIDAERTGWLPQLLNPIEREDFPEALTRCYQRVALQTKHDGERRIIIGKGREVIGSNRKGLQVPVHDNTESDIRRIMDFYELQELVVDTEDMGDYVVIFDVLNWDHDLTAEAFRERMPFLRSIQEVVDMLELNCKVDIPDLVATTERMELYTDKAETRNEEGIVIRDLSAVYTAGRPNSWGPCLKLKFYDTVTCIVSGVHPTKRSVSLAVMDPHALPETIEVGNCTIPPNYDIPEPGDLVEVKYLYAYRGGSLYQPQYKGVRTDLESADTLDQIKFKD